MLVRSTVAAARQQNLPLQRLLSSTALLRASQCRVSHFATSAPRRHISSTQTPRPSTKRGSKGLPGLERSLATVVEEHRRDTNLEIPPNNLYEHKPLIISEPVRTHGGSFAPIKRSNKLGLPSGVQEMLCVYDACIRVGRLERAMQVLKRLQPVLPPRDQVELHDRFLEARLVQMQDAGPGEDLGDDLHHWFEVQIRSHHLPYTHDTIALLLKASLIGESSSMPLRVRRYMSMLEKETALETLYIGGLLDPDELSRIAQVCPEYNTQALLQEPAQEEADDKYTFKEGKSPSSPVPQVMVTPQKGVGLKMLRETLSIFDEIPQRSSIHSLPVSERQEIQSRLEEDCVEAAAKRWKEQNQSLMDMGLNSALSRPALSTKLYEWHRDLEQRLVKEIALVEAAEASEDKSAAELDRCSYGPFLRLLPARRLAATTIISVLSSLAVSGVAKGSALSVVVNSIGSAVEEELRTQSRADELKKGVNDKVALKRSSRNPRRFRSSAPARDALAAGPTADGSLPTLPTTDFSWTTTIRIQVGCALFQALMEVAKLQVVREDPKTNTLVSQTQPAFVHTLQFKRGKKIGVIMPNQELVDMLTSQPDPNVLARQLPMVVQPAPWTAFDRGGFLVTPTSLVRLKSGERDQKIYTEAALARGDMDQVLQGLDILGKTAWTINRDVFDVMLEAWNTGEKVANIPPLNPVFNLPPEPDATGCPVQRRNWMRIVKRAENEKAGLHSERCHMNLQLEIARSFLGQVFYFPHNIDFRGRAYPLPAYLNHMGADHARGLLMFAKGKPLGEEGLRWLKVHLANVYGYDKASLSEREQFAVDNLDNVRDSVANPFTGKRWWLQAEDPWQCLATCFEFARAMDSADPTQYVSQLPVHQDGTCNGLQHYAALGGDTWGATQVNLVPGDRPADVYSAVAQLVEELIAKDVETGHKLAALLTGKITRKVVKQTVMTNVYGVTYMGAKAQVEKQLFGLYPDLLAEAGLDNMHPVSTYITHKIFAALANMFRGAHDIQAWLGEIGGRVCMSVTPEQMADLFDGLEETSPLPKEEAEPTKRKPWEAQSIPALFRSSIVWTTPLRMPVVQPYRQVNRTLVKTCLQDLAIMKPDPFDPVNKRKQLQAFPPNFIHSLDASHMLLSALACDEQGLTFAAVHDSFWTHASDVTAMSHVLRDAFIRIHQEDVIGRLLAEFQVRYRGSYYLARIKLDSEVGKRVVALRGKKTGARLLRELKEERDRQRLLRSPDPKEYQRGKEMVTPTSLYEQFSQATDVVTEWQNPEAGRGGNTLISDEEDVDDIELSAGASEAPKTEEAESDEAESAEADSEEAELEARASFSRILKGKSTRPSIATTTTHIWVPLTFPDVPAKGEFDVTMLKESKYFFS
ncbi:hypothetical protein V8F20_007554 [Naviculisporaceae sp. PSN 640]